MLVVGFLAGGSVGGRKISEVVILGEDMSSGGNGEDSHSGRARYHGPTPLA